VIATSCMVRIWGEPGTGTKTLVCIPPTTRGRPISPRLRSVKWRRDTRRSWLSPFWQRTQALRAADCRDGSLDGSDHRRRRRARPRPVGRSRILWWIHIRARTLDRCVLAVCSEEQAPRTRFEYLDGVVYQYVTGTYDEPVVRLSSA